MKTKKRTGLMPRTTVISAVLMIMLIAAMVAASVFIPDMGNTAEGFTISWSSSSASGSTTLDPNAFVAEVNSFEINTDAGYYYHLYYGSQGDGKDSNKYIEASDRYGEVHIYWEIKFTGLLYKAIKNGSISSISFKADTHCDGTTDYRDFILYSDDKHSNKISNAYYGGNDGDYTLTLDLNNENLRKAYDDGESYTLYAEIHDWVNWQYVGLTLHGLWMDIYPNTDVKPSITQNGDTFTFTDSKVGVNKVWYKRNYDSAETEAVITKNADGSSATWTAPQGGAYNIRVENNIGQSASGVYAVHKYSGGIGTSASPYRLANRDDMESLSAIVNLAKHDYSGQYLQIANNIDMGSELFRPIGESTDKPFKGTLDGNGCTINNLNISTSGYAGLIGVLSEGTISNSQTAPFTINGTINGTGSATAAFVAYSSSGNISGNLTNNASVTGIGMVGGIGGQIHATFGSGNYVNTGSIVGTSNSVGGVFGFTDKALANARNTGDVQGLYAVGGIVGRSQGSLTGMYNSGHIVATGTGNVNEGGINVSSVPFVGGIVGYQINFIDDDNKVVPASINNCYNSGRVEKNSDGYNNYIGGIVGASSVDIKYCYNEGHILGAENVGGIVGRMFDNKSVSYCYNNGRIQNTWDENGAMRGTIRGDAHGSNSTWDIRSIKHEGYNTGTKHNAGRLIDTALGDILPATGTEIFGSWEDIISHNIDRIAVRATTGADQYLYSQIASDNSQFRTITAAKCIDSNGTQNTVYTALIYDANATQNIYVTQLSITDVTSKTLTYSGTPQYLDGVIINNYSTELKYYSDAGYSNEVTPQNAGSYYVAVTVFANNQPVGRRRAGHKLTINKQTITITPTYINGTSPYTFNGQSQGLSTLTFNGLHDELEDIADITASYVNQEGCNTGSYPASGNVYSGIFTVHAGEYSITVSKKSGGVADNYEFSNATYRWNINKFDISNAVINYKGKSNKPSNFNWNELQLTPVLFYVGEYTETEYREYAENNSNIPVYFASAQLVTSTVHGKAGNIMIALSDFIAAGDSDGVQYSTYTITVGGDNFTGRVILGAYLMSGDFAGGDGTETEPYLISHWAHMYRFMQIVNDRSNSWNTGFGDNSDEQFTERYVSLGTSLDITDEGNAVGEWSDDTKTLFGYAPIGIKNTNTGGFRGRFDGGENIINLTLNITDDRMNAGLFGYITTDAAVKNFTVTGKVSHSKGYAGGAVGYADSNAVISGVTNQAIVSAGGGRSESDGRAGGILGYGYGAELRIDNAVNRGDVTASVYAGGIVGQLRSGAVNHAENTGNVFVVGTGNRCAAGGIVGCMDDGAIANAYSSAVIETGEGVPFDIGGIVGYVGGGSVRYAVYETAGGSSDIIQEGSQGGGTGTVVGRIAHIGDNDRKAVVEYVYSINVKLSLPSGMYWGVAVVDIDRPWDTTVIKNAIAFYGDEIAPEMGGTGTDAMGVAVKYYSTLQRGEVPVLTALAGDERLGDWKDIVNANIDGFELSVSNPAGAYTDIYGEDYADFGKITSDAEGNNANTNVTFIANLSESKSIDYSMSFAVREIAVKSHTTVYDGDPHDIFEQSDNGGFLNGLPSYITLYADYQAGGEWNITEYLAEGDLDQGWKDSRKSDTFTQTTVGKRGDEDAPYNAYIALYIDGVLVGYRAADGNDRLTLDILAAPIDVSGHEGEKLVQSLYGGTASNAGADVYTVDGKEYPALHPWNDAESWSNELTGAQIAKYMTVRTLVYADDSYKNESFLLYYAKFAGGDKFLMQDRDYDVEFIYRYHGDKTAYVEEYAYAKLVGKGNYTGTLYIYYVLINSDFGGNYSAENWGSEGNPYLIESWAHLVRLSEIAAGKPAWNSLTDKNEYAVCESANFEGGYFSVTADIEAEEDGVLKLSGQNPDRQNSDYGFAPIGEKHPFAGIFDGGGHTIRYYYSGSPDGGSREYKDYTGLFGRADGANIHSLTVTGRAAGKGIVGGLVGYARNCDICDITSTVLVGAAAGGADTGAGGIIGRAIDCNIGDKSGGIMRYIPSAAKIPSLINSGYGAVFSDNDNTGGIVGYISGGKVQGTLSAHFEDSVSQQVYVVRGEKYVGGLIGCADKTVLAFTARETYGAIAGDSHVGGIAGYAEGTLSGNERGIDEIPEAGTDNTVTVVTDTNGSSMTVAMSLNGINNDTFQGNVGGLFGYLSHAALLTDGTEVTWINTKAIKSAGENVGGVIGYAGARSAVYGRYENRAEISGAAANAGGIIGYLADGAGVYEYTETYAFGNKAHFKSSGNVSGASRVGGIIGGSGQEGSGGETNVDYTRYYAVSRNYGSIRAGGDDAGGIIGRAGARIVLILQGTSDADATYSKSADTTKNITVSAQNNAGGIAGVLVEGNNLISGAYSIASVSAGNYAGGIVGRMYGGGIESSFATANAITYRPYSGNFVTVTASDGHAGGIAGYAEAGSITDCYTQGFDHGTVSATKGGVAGYGHPTQSSITDSWAVYVFDGYALRTGSNDESKKSGKEQGYRAASANGNGKYILLDDRVTADGLMTTDEMKVLIGIAAENDSEVIMARNAREAASTYMLKAKKGSISVKALIPYFNDVDGTENNIDDGVSEPRQLVLYDGSGEDRTSDNAFAMTEDGTHLYIRLGMDGESYTLALTEITFRNIPKWDSKNDQNKTEWIQQWINAYRRPANDSNYAISGIAPVADDQGWAKSASGSVKYGANNGAGSGETFTMGKFNKSYSTGSSEATPYIISSKADWKDFASKVQNGTDTFAGKTIRLDTDLTDTNALGIGDVFGDISKGGPEAWDGGSAYFAGTFDGDGHTVQFNYDGNAPRVSLFPNASGATFKNLTIEGSINSPDGYDIAAFVGKPFGDLKFYNCVSEVTINANRLAAGIVGYTRGYSLTIESCVNRGDIKTTQEDTTSYKNYQYGTGGIIANVENETVIESCYNEGNITGGANVGGIVGRADAKITFNSCGNSGNILATVLGSFSNVWGQPGNGFGCAGGILGRTDTNGWMEAYNCYNSGEVCANDNMAGGIVGSLGQYEAGELFTGVMVSYDKITVKNKSRIESCYNTGNIFAGGKNRREGVAAVGAFASERINLCGTVVGGIAGIVGDCDIIYCYNTGDVTSHGSIGYGAGWHFRMGGIVGQANPDKNGYTVNVSKSYNTGAVIGKDAGEEGGYGSGVVGYTENSDRCSDNTYVSNCYSLKYAVRYETENNVTWWYEEWNDNKTGLGTDPVLSSTKPGETAYINDFTAAMDSTGKIKPSDTIYNGLGQNNGNKLDGWIYPYGCLPQLAVFALDTYNELSMKSVNYGKDGYEEYVRQQAGDEFSPYIIKDGVDLLSLAALTETGGTGKGKYIEFADGKNNLKGDKVSKLNLAAPKTADGTFSNEATQVTNGTLTYYAPDETNCYKFYDADSTLKDENDKIIYIKTGKSYHLYTKGSVMADDYNVSGDKYVDWINKNHKPSGSGTYVSGATLDDVNFHTIARTADSAFEASLSGGENTPEIVQLKVDETAIGTVYAGLIGRLSGGTLDNVALSGSIIGRASGTVYAGIAAEASGAAVISRVKAGSTSNKLTITAHGTGNNAVGGIAGRLYTGSANTTLTVSEVEAVDVTVTGCAQGVGGIAGTADGVSESNIVIESATVTNAAVNTSAEGDKASLIGGVLGGRTGENNAVTLIIYNANVAGGTVSGRHAVGGILGAADGDTTIRDSKVGESVTISAVAENKYKYGAAIGGFAGYADGALQIDGTANFAGKIEISDDSTDDTTVVRNIGGLFGYMGGGASILNGNIAVSGSIDTSKVSVTAGNLRNIGGIAGAASGAVFNGSYTVTTTFDTLSADNVGGFVGYNMGEMIVLAGMADTNDKGENVGGSKITIGSEPASGGIVSAQTEIKGANNVGGFVGLNKTLGTSENNTDAQVRLGVASHESVLYDGTLTMNNYAAISASGNNVGGIVGGNEAAFESDRSNIANNGSVGGNDNTGGIIGANGAKNDKNEIVGSFSSTANTVTGNTGSVSGTNNVGGVIGNSVAEFSAQGTTAGNTGSVKGSENVGGSIGSLSSGTLSGVYLNNGEVTGVYAVGGVIGRVHKDGTILSAAMTNTGAVSYDTASTHQSAGSAVGGAIGVFFGTITGTEDAPSEFGNEGTVTALSYSGGIIGVLAGAVSFADFSNSGNLTFGKADGVNADALGGAIGIITSVTGGEADAVETKVTDSRFEYVNKGTGGGADEQGGEDEPSAAAEGTTKITVNGTSSDDVGGIGGVVGIINATDIKSSQQWNNVVMYVNGSVSAKSADYVGGVAGKILNSYITIKNMLAYDNKVEGNSYVGGIVGFNGSINKNSGADASLVECYNVGGEVVGKSNVGGIVGAYDETIAPQTYSCYWIVGFANEKLQIYDITNGTTLDTTNFTREVIAKVPTEPVEGFETELEFGDEYIEAYKKVVFDKYNADHDPDIQLEDIYIFNGSYVYNKADGNSTSYSTGTVYTGNFFAYANDVVTNGYADENIVVQHSAPAGGASTNAINDLDFWKRIANAYSIDDEKFGSYNSSVVYDGGEVRQGHFYATAKTPTKDGYYLFMRAFGADGAMNTVYDGGTDGDAGKFFLDFTAAEAGNALVFYKQPEMDGTGRLVYNGNERYAPLKGMSNSADSPLYGYYYTPNSNGGSGTAREVGNYNVSADIYFVAADKDGNRTNVKVGNANDIEWTISARPLTVSDPEYSKNDQQYGGDVRYIKFTVDNVAGNDTVSGSVTADERLLSMMFVTGIEFDVNNILPYTDNTVLEAGKIYRRIIKAESGMSGEDAKYNTQPYNDDLYRFEYYVCFKDAGIYFVTMKKDGGIPSSNYSMKTVNAELTIRQKTIEANGVWTDGDDNGSFIYDGAEHGIDISFDGFIDGETNEVIDAFIKALTVNVSINKQDAADFTAARDIDGIHIRSVNVAVYTAEIKGELGNYILKDYEYKWTIAVNVISIEWDNKSPYIYDNTVKSAIAIFKPEKPIANWDDILLSMKPTINGGTYTAAENEDGSCTVTFSTGKDAGTYTAVVSDNTGSDNYVFNEDSIKSVNIVINKRRMTVTPSMDNSTIAYDTRSHAAKTEEPTIEGGFKVDDVSVSLRYNGSTSAGVNVGEYKVTVGSVSIKIGGEDVTKNFEITKNECSYEITPVTITIVTWSPTEFVYDKQAHVPDITQIRVNGSPLNGTNSFTYINDTIRFTVTGAQVNAGQQHTASVSKDGFTAFNGSTDRAQNYLFEGDTKEFTIAKSKQSVSLEWEGAKVYDALTDYDKNKKDEYDIIFTFRSTNYGAQFNGKVDYSAVFDSKDVGDRTVTVSDIKAAGEDLNNYEFNLQSEYPVAAKIVSRPLTVSLYDRSGAVYKTYNKYGKYGVATNVNGETDMRSDIYRLGQGFTVANVAAAEANGYITLTVNFIAAGGDAAVAYDAYVNGAGNGNEYKALKFVLSGESASNYTVSVAGGTLADGILYDSDDEEHNKDGGGFTISINQYSVNPSYQNLVQSYISDDAEYRAAADYKDVSAAWTSPFGDGTTIDVVNDWKQEHRQYTVIRGADGGELSARFINNADPECTKNYRLRTQPTLIIGYFIEKDEGAYEIDSLADLLLATYYYKLSFDETVTSIERSEWVVLATAADYEAYDPSANDGKTWEQYLAERYGVDIAEIIEDANGDWGYFRTVTEQAAKYLSFIQTDNISGVMSAQDLDFIENELRTEQGSEWGRGTDKLSNFYKTAVGGVVTAIGSVFGDAFEGRHADGTEEGIAYTVDGFHGSYDGNGYVIDKFNIISAGKGDMYAGFFGRVSDYEAVGSNAEVKNVHLRNITLTVSHAGEGDVYVGGAAAHYQGDAEDLSFHGSIRISNAAGTLYAGGVVGRADGAVKNAMVFGSMDMTASGTAYIGGIVGHAGSADNTASMIEISTNNSEKVSPIAGSGNVTDSHYLDFTVYDSANKQPVEKTYEGAASYGYDDFRNVENVIADKVWGGDAEVRYSMSIADTIDIFILMFEAEEKTADGNKMYAGGLRSALTGTSDGTSNNPILLAHQQHVSLLRMFRFAHFTLTRDITMYTSNKEYVYGGLFYGTVNGGDNYKIYLVASDEAGNVTMFEKELNPVPVALKREG